MLGLGLSVSRICRIGYYLVHVLYSIIHLIYILWCSASMSVAELIHYACMMVVDSDTLTEVVRRDVSTMS